MKSEMFRVAIAEGVIQQLIELPRPIAKKANEWIQKFRQNPQSTGLNFERIQNARDRKLRSLRVDDDYRAIVAAPERGNVYLLLRIGKHDDAYRWAENARVEVHPETGGLQVFQSQVEPEPASEQAPELRRGLYAGIRDRELVRLGIPEKLLGDVRSIETEDDLLARVNTYPKLAWDALAGLAEGKTPDEVYAEQATTSAPVDPEDFEAALDSPETQASFFVADDQEELLRVLNQPLERWRIFLHPSQRRLVERRWNGPVRVLGSAGTGKTVVAMHRARWLARNVAVEPGQRVLFTTFTHNLAADIRASLEKLCSPDELGRIDVAHLHGWAHDYLRHAGVDFQIVYDEHRLREAWEVAMTRAEPSLSLEEPFYKAEWTEIVVANGIRDEEAYLRVPRTGRGVRLNRLQRKQVWPVFDAFRAELERRRWKDGDEALLHAAEMLDKGGASAARYRSVIVDEAQDLSGPALRLIRALAPEQANDLFLVGDGHQRIYRRRVAMSRFGIDIRGRGRRLQINYRTTEEIRRFAMAVLEGVPIDDLDGGTVRHGTETSLLHGIQPVTETYPAADAEMAAAIRHVKGLIEGGAADSEICITARTNRLVESIKRALKEAGMPVHELRRTTADDRRKPGVRIGTMHRIKGLEFDHVLIVGASRDAIPYPAALLCPTFRPCDRPQRRDDPVPKSMPSVDLR